MLKSALASSKYHSDQRNKPRSHNQSNKQRSYPYNYTSIAYSKQNENVARILKKVGLGNITKICDTLQGNIFRTTKIENKSKSMKRRTAVVKVTNKYLHKHSMATVADREYNVDENILLEQSILKFLTQNKNCPESIVKFRRFFTSKSDYYLVMEDGGTSLFDFIERAHKVINTGTIDRNHWQKVVKIIFKQMIECIEYIHSKNVCHFDISLENFLINDVEVEVKQHRDGEQITFLLDDIQIKLCDFGLAQLFPKSECLSNKYCGKQPYKSPEVIDRRKKFDAKKNDIWMAGVCLFMMITGHAPWYVANKNDVAFQFVINGHLTDLLDAWNLLNYVNENLADLFESIFQYEADRISLNKIKKHAWIV